MLEDVKEVNRAKTTMRALVDDNNEMSTMGKKQDEGAIEDSKTRARELTIES
ncbi:hypothetical protein MUK42_03375 [Musa troglodytarum]|uniref:Uncharacterized protein n=1 Tax=Musa troglodytarum TaxID=320322 RepID=A0A9E7HJH7_9LILI|nr:hypothetical protein MUK42_03375 [Musa troglodytarum]